MSTCAPLYIQIVYGDVATCTARTKLSCAASLTATGSGATGAMAESCVTTLMTQNCDDFIEGFVSGLSDGSPATCGATGTLAVGAACGANTQCTTGYCNIGATGCGVCATPVAVGGSCFTAACAKGLICLDQGQTCATPASLGSACSDSIPCKATAFCNDSHVCATAGNDAGTACSTLNSSSCNSLGGLYCAQTNTCAPVAFADAGSLCGNVAATGQPVLCRASESCTAAGPCAASAADGAACDDAAGPNCLPPAQCVNSICKAPNPSGCM